MLLLAVKWVALLVWVCCSSASVTAKRQESSREGRSEIGARGGNRSLTVYPRLGWSGSVGGVLELLCLTDYRVMNQPDRVTGCARTRARNLRPALPPGLGRAACSRPQPAALHTFGRTRAPAMRALAHLRARSGFTAAPPRSPASTGEGGGPHQPDARALCARALASSSRMHDPAGTAAPLRSPAPAAPPRLPAHNLPNGA